MPNDECLLLLAHGSPDPRWRKPFEHLVRDLAVELNARGPLLAYMEFIPPTLADAVAEAGRRGLRRIAILPLFMSGGGHVATDIPAQVEAARQVHPGVAIRVLPPVGEHPRFQKVLREIIRDLQHRA
ncbi:MAG: cobalamin biosynthesis protein CbiX [Acidobacteria bacterium]|nr:cobalamin biosynthesis protein CbiX [Acidobacteriota bacterium]